MLFFTDKLRKPDIIKIDSKKQIGAELGIFKNQASQLNRKTRHKSLIYRVGE